MKDPVVLPLGSGTGPEGRGTLALLHVQEAVAVFKVLRLEGGAVRLLVMVFERPPVFQTWLLHLLDTHCKDRVTCAAWHMTIDNL